MSDWILTSNQQPTEQDEYLITFTASDYRGKRTRPFIEICEYSIYKGIGAWCTDLLRYPDIEVIAWQPLPDPAKVN